MAVNGHIKITCSGSRFVEWRKLKEFQGELKELTKDSLEKLKNSIKRHGFAAPVFVWKGHDYILDGHQRLKAIDKLIAEGMQIDNKLPVVDIEAENKEEAKELVLSYNSQYGHITDEGLYEFIQDLNWNELTSIIDLPNIDEKLFEAGYIKDSDFVNNVSEEWKEMPEFEHSGAFRSLIIHFKDQNSFKDFCFITKLKIEEKAKSTWF